ncbi:MAG: hypothetical protein AAF310_05300 [Myxococcota bacterium]
MSIAQVLRQEGEKVGMQKGEKMGMQKGEKVGMQKGEKMGMQKGEKVGMQKGKKEGLETAATGMLNKGMATEDVIEITHLSPKRIAQLKAELKRKTGSSD